MQQIKTPEEDSTLHSIDALLEYANTKMRCIFSARIKYDYYTTLYLNIKTFTMEAGIYQGWFEKSYEIPFSRIYENGEERYQTSKKDIDKAIETFKKDLEKHEAGSRTIKNRIKNDSRIQAWIASIIITVLMFMIGAFNELSFNEKKELLLNSIFGYSIISLLIAFICNHAIEVKIYKMFPMWFFIVHGIIAAPFIYCLVSHCF